MAPCARFSTPSVPYMIVRPDAMSARSAPSARPLNSCELKLAQVITRETVVPAQAGTTFLLRVVPQVAAECVGLLHERRAGNDLGHLPEVLLVAHRLRRLAAHDDHRAHHLVVFLADVHLADHGLELAAGLERLDHV